MKDFTDFRENVLTDEKVKELTGRAKQQLHPERSSVYDILKDALGEDEANRYEELNGCTEDSADMTVDGLLSFSASLSLFLLAEYHKWLHQDE